MSDAKYQDIQPLTTKEVVELDLIELVQHLLESKDKRHEFLVAFLMWQVSTQVKMLRLDRRWTQSELAEKAGLSTHTVIRLEHPKRCLNISINTLLKIAEAFNCGLVIRFCAYSDLLKEIAELQGDKFMDKMAPRDSDDVLERIALEKWAKSK